MKKEDLFNDEFLKHLQKRGIEKMLEANLMAIWAMARAKSRTILTPETALAKKRYALPLGNRRFRSPGTEMLSLTL